MLTEGDISDLTVSCPAEVVITGQAETGGGSDPTAVAFSKSRQGNVLTWADFKHGLHGGVVIGESPFCRGCPDPMAPLYGIVQVSGANEAIYTCNLGYTLTPSSFQLTSAADRSSPDYDSNSNSNSKENRTVVRRNCMVTNCRLTHSADTNLKNRQCLMSCRYTEAGTDRNPNVSASSAVSLVTSSTVW